MERGSPICVTQQNRSGLSSDTHHMRNRWFQCPLVLGLLLLGARDAHAIRKPFWATSVSVGCWAIDLHWEQINDADYYIVRRFLDDSESLADSTTVILRPTETGAPAPTSYRDIGLLSTGGLDYRYYIYAVGNGGQVSEPNVERVNFMAECGALPTKERIRVVVHDFADWRIRDSYSAPAQKCVTADGGVFCTHLTKDELRTSIRQRLLGTIAYGKRTPNFADWLRETSMQTVSVESVDVYFSTLPKARGEYDCPTVEPALARAQRLVDPLEPDNNWYRAMNSCGGMSAMLWASLVDDWNDTIPTTNAQGLPYTKTFDVVMGVFFSPFGFPGQRPAQPIQNWLEETLGIDSSLVATLFGGALEQLDHVMLPGILLQDKEFFSASNYQASTGQYESKSPRIVAYPSALEVIAHEYLHNSGPAGNFNPHAATWRCSDRVLSRAVLSPHIFEMGRDFVTPDGHEVSCGVEAYGDIYEIMGGGPLNHSSTYRKVKNKFLPASAVAVLPKLSVDSAGREIPQVFELDLYQAELPTSASRLREIRVPLASEAFYTLELRSDAGYNGRLGVESFLTDADPSNDAAVDSIYFSGLTTRQLLPYEGVVPRIKTGSNAWLFGWTPAFEGEFIADTVAPILWNPVLGRNAQTVLRPRPTLCVARANRSSPNDCDAVSLDDPYRKVRVEVLSIQGSGGDRRARVRISRP